MEPNLWTQQFPEAGQRVGMVPDPWRNADTLLTTYTLCSSSSSSGLLPSTARSNLWIRAFLLPLLLFVLTRMGRAIHNSNDKTTNLEENGFCQCSLFPRVNPFDWTPRIKHMLRIKAHLHDLT